jgi:uncharacterized protein
MRRRSGRGEQRRVARRRQKALIIRQSELRRLLVSVWIDKQVYKSIYSLMLGFDWDDGNRKKCAARVPIDEIESVLADPETIVVPQFALSVSDDPEAEEQRYRATGKNREGRGVLVVFTTRIIDGELRLRPISVHYVSRKKK